MSSFFEELKRRNVVRVALAYIITAWLIAQVADLALDAFAAPDWVMKTILLVLLIGFPLAIVFAWAFEKTPDGIKLEKNVDRSQSITNMTGKKMDRGIIVALAIAVVFLLYKVNVDDPAQPASGTSTEVSSQPSKALVASADAAEPSVAVLPFVNMSDDPANEYFSDGISEELLNVLVKVSTLKVASRTSSFSFKGKDISIPEIAEQLKVDHVLEGSVRKAGNRVRITAQLIEVSTDRHIWSETYDRELEDIFAIQDEISGHIVEALQAALAGSQQATPMEADQPTQNLRSYEAYLQGRYFWQRRGEDNIKKAIELFKRAIDLDPDFARAWSSLAAAYITLPSYSAEAGLEPIYFPKAQTAATKALELDASLAEAHAVLGDIARIFGDNWAAAEEHYLAALRNEPKNPTGHLWYGEFLFATGRLKDAIHESEIAQELDPLSPGTNVNLGGLYEIANRNEEAGPLLQTGWELGHAWGKYLLGMMNTQSKNYNQAIEDFTAVEEKLNIPLGLFSGTPKALRDHSPQAAIDTLRSKQDPTLAVFRVSHLVLLGDVDGAYQVVHDNPDQLKGNNLFELWTRHMAPFRQDPRFIELIKKLGLDSYWRQAEWADDCQPKGDTFTCR